MTTYKSLLEMTADEWRAALDLALADVPAMVIVEGSWWRQTRTDFSLSYLTNVRELKFPDMYWGRWQGTPVAYCCAYGAARAAEPVHIFCRLGARLAVQIGTCLALQAHLATGDIVLPETAACEEGVARQYGAEDTAAGSAEWIRKACQWLGEQDLTTFVGPHMTWASLLTQRAELVEAWQACGYLGKDMETAATYAVSHRFGVPAVAMLVAWQDANRNRNFLAPLEPAEAQALDRGRQGVYEAALALAAAL